MNFFCFFKQLANSNETKETKGILGNLMFYKPNANDLIIFGLKFQLNQENDDKAFSEWSSFRIIGCLPLFKPSLLLALLLAIIKTTHPS